LSRISIDKLQPYFFITPTVLLLVLVFGIPLVWAVFLSFHEYNMMTPERPFVGLANYVDLLTSDRVFWKSVRVTAIWTLASVSLEYIFALFVAVLLNEAGKLRGLFRAVVALPWAVPPVVAGLIWRTIYDPNVGILNQVLKTLGLIKESKAWLAEPNLVLPCLILVVVWKYGPFMILALLAALQSIPQELYDAAAVDGARAWQRFRYVTLPLLMPVTTVILTLGVIWRARHFDIVWTLTQGGPGTTSELLAVNAYRRTIMTFKAGMGSTVAILLALLELGFMIYMLRRLLMTQ
jgi:multiple sugar transport system permease protein